jgi:hypothetical protein
MRCENCDAQYVVTSVFEIVRQILIQCLDEHVILFKICPQKSATVHNAQLPTFHITILQFSPYIYCVFTIH